MKILLMKFVAQGLFFDEVIRIYEEANLFTELVG